MSLFVVNFSDYDSAVSSAGDSGLDSLLGHKGKMLCELTKRDFPVPPGFVVCSTAVKAYFESEEPNSLPEDVISQIRDNIQKIESSTGKKFGGENPLFLCIRCSPSTNFPHDLIPFVPLIGRTQDSTQALAASSEDPKSVWNVYIEQLKAAAPSIAAEKFEDVEGEVKGEKDELEAEDMPELCNRYKELILSETETPVTDDPVDELKDALQKCCNAWNSEKVIEYRNENQIEEGQFPAFIVEMVIMGNHKTNTLVSRDPVTGQANEVSFDGMDDSPACVDKVKDILHKLDFQYRESAKIDFQVDGDNVYICKCDITKKPEDAELRFLINYVKDGILPKDDLIKTIDVDELNKDTKEIPVISEEDLQASDEKIFAKATGAAPGYGCGQLAFTPEKAAELHEGEQDYIYICKTAKQEDYKTIADSKGVITYDPSPENSYAVAVAKYARIPAIIGLPPKKVKLDMEEMSLSIKEVSINEGDVVTIDGNAGTIYSGDIPFQPIPPSVFEQPEFQQIAEAGDEFRFSTRKDGKHALMIYATAENPDDAAQAREKGAEGIGLCNTDSLLLGDSVESLQRLIIGHEEEEDRDATRQGIEDAISGEIGGMLEALGGFPIVLRLSDNQLKEYLPDILELIDEVETLKYKKSKGEEIEEEEIHEKVESLNLLKSLYDENPMVGIRGIRLSLHVPGLLRAQIRAIVEAGFSVAEKEIEAQPIIALPFLSDISELLAVKPILNEAIQQIAKDHEENEAEVHPKFKLAAMIEVPRAVFITGELAKECDALIFNTDLLIQQIDGVDAEDADSTFMPQYSQMGISEKNPIDDIDEEGLGRLLEIGVKKAKEANSQILVGVTGKLCNSPKAIFLFHKIGFDFVSCSVDALLNVRLAAARAILSD